MSLTSEKKLWYTLPGFNSKLEIALLCEIDTYCIIA